LRSGFYDLLAGAILQCELGRSARNTRLKDLGFEQSDEVRNRLSYQDIVAIAGIVFVAMNAGVLPSRTFAPQASVSSSVMIPAMVSIIYALALVVAIYPKGLWRFFDIAALGRRPMGAYLVSATLAAILSLFISLTFKFVFMFPGDFVGALKDTQYRWPWLVMTGGITFAIAWAADDYYRKGKDAPPWLRFAERSAWLLCSSRSSGGPSSYSWRSRRTAFPPTVTSTFAASAWRTMFVSVSCTTRKIALARSPSLILIPLGTSIATEQGIPNLLPLAPIRDAPRARVALAAFAPILVAHACAR
jgi:hypothetical protein